MTLPRIVPDELRVRGRTREVPEDFEVTEIPAYEPVGHGEHLFLWVEKRGRNTEDVIRALTRLLRVPPTEVGTAGMKDRHAVTRQFVSVPFASLPEESQTAVRAGGLPELDLGNDIRVLKAGLHENKLRTGHLYGNRFRIRVRGVSDGAEQHACESAEILRTKGLLNAYGSQRFGRDGETLRLGEELIRKGRSSRKLSRSLKRLALSAVQSHLFNQVLNHRHAESTLFTVLAGDVMQKAPAGGKFVAEDVDAEQKRLDAGETLITGPMFGRKMQDPKGRPLEIEESVLAGNDFTRDSFSGHGKLLLGARRPLVVPLPTLTVTTDTDGLILEFELPAGSYATRVLDEMVDEAVPGVGSRH